MEEASLTTVKEVDGGCSPAPRHRRVARPADLTCTAKLYLRHHCPTLGQIRRLLPSSRPWEGRGRPLLHVAPAHLLLSSVLAGDELDDFASGRSTQRRARRSIRVAAS
uniref:Uncharacterized protein n=1 Tax=Oryza barthii TaxID=65489 RepID=A0A0D3H1H3_9ORYZ